MFEKTNQIQISPKNTARPDVKTWRGIKISEDILVYYYSKLAVSRFTTFSLHSSENIPIYC